MKNSELFKEFVEFLLQIYLKTILRVVLLADLIKKTTNQIFFADILVGQCVYFDVMCVCVGITCKRVGFR